MGDLHHTWATHLTALSKLSRTASASMTLNAGGRTKVRLLLATRRILNPRRAPCPAIDPRSQLPGYAKRSSEEDRGSENLTGR